MNATIRKILFASDGSDHALQAMQRWAAKQSGPGLQSGSAELHLLNVQLPVDGNVRTFVNADELHAYHREEGMAALEPMRQWLGSHGLNAQVHILVGHPADQICRFAQERGMSEIVIGSHGRSGLLELLMGSVANEVKANSQVPVTVI